MRQKDIRIHKAAAGNRGENQSGRPLEIDLKKIFLTPPSTGKEKVILLVMLVITFIAFFGPICFSPISPIKAILLSCAPALTTSWGWMVLLRSLFRKSEFCKEPV